MNLSIIPPSQFNRVRWKNGQGYTLELAIDSGNLPNYDWRISIASVTESGAFSNFSGYRRNQVLLQGDGDYINH